MKKLYDILPVEKIKQNEPMKNHTTFKIGGAADFFITPETLSQLQAVIEFAKAEAVPYYVMGNGSNLLVSDKGIRGLVIQTTGINHIKTNDTEITAGAGVLLSRVAVTALRNSLTGLEFAQGIPGTIGGGVAMNAGAYDGELKNVVRTTCYLDSNNTVQRLTDHKFEYRRTIFTDNPDWIILETTLELNCGEPHLIEEKMHKFASARKSKQPIEMPSAGSTFKRPPDNYASKLIDDCGLRGFSVGDAQISPKHCGFIVNNGNATAQNVIDLIHYIQDKVMADFGVALEAEVKLVGEWQ